jgi:hypothetical protein
MLQMRIRLVLLLGLISLLSVSIFAQGSKTLLIDRPLNSDPVRIVKVTAGTTEVKSDGTRFPNKYSWQGVIDNAAEDWLTGLSLTIQNVSTKKIVYLGVSCLITETANWKQEVATHSLILNKSPEPALGQLNNRIGLRPEPALYSVSLGHKLHPDPGPAFELAPGQTYTIAYENPDNYPGLKSSVEERKGSISAVNGCSGGISDVFFEDGTRWQGHRYLRPDPDKRGQWIRLSSEEWLGAKPEAKP